MKRDAMTTATGPSGGFQWNAEWKRQLPILRGVNVPPLPDAGPTPSFRAVRGEDNPLASFFQPNAWTYWATRARDFIPERVAKAAELAEGSRERWEELLAQAVCSEWIDYGMRPSYYEGRDTVDRARARGGYVRPVPWVVRHCVEALGVVATVELVLGLWRREPARHRYAWDWRSWPLELLRPLRHALALADDATHDAALALAESMRGTDPHLLRACIQLFPQRTDWVAEWLALGQPEHEPLVVDALLTAAQLEAYLALHPHAMSGGNHRAPEIVSAVLLQLQRDPDAGFALLARLLREAFPRDDATEINLLLGVAQRTWEPGLPALLAEGMVASRRVRVAMEKLGKAFPAAVLNAALAQALAGRNRSAECHALRFAVLWPDAVDAALAGLEPGARARAEAWLAMLAREPAPPTALPPLLRDPPWLRADRPATLPAFDVPAIPTPDAAAWPDPVEFARVRDWQPDDGTHVDRDEAGFPRALGLTPEGARRLLAGEPLRPGDAQPPEYGASRSDVLHAPRAAQLALWESYPAWNGWGSGLPVRTADAMVYVPAHVVLLARFGAAVVPSLVREVTAHAGRAPWLAMRLDTPALVPPMLHLARNVRLHRTTGERWLAAFPHTALQAALPVAFSTKHSAARDDARHGIRWLVAQGHAPVAREAAAVYGGAMPAALEALLATDPLDVLPGEMPAVPDFAVVAACRRPELRGGGLLSVDAASVVVQMLMISPLHSPYAGLAIVKDACTPGSLAEFAWDLYEGWEAADAPAGGRWAFAALAHLGDGETVRRLVTRINAWGGEDGMRGRAEDALALLAAIGTDIALSRLNQIALKGRHNRVKKRATAMIQEVAQQRGLSLEELGDRLAPTLGLEEDGATTLDFGPRQFRIAFDESLAPHVRDAQGRRLKDPPKPMKTDDADLAAAAMERWKLLRKEARAIATLQVTRLERAMVDRRRWRAADFLGLFARHPLVRHLATRLVWGRYDAEGRLAQAFRVAEDGTLADRDDALLAMDDEATVGLPHRLELDRDTLAAFGRLWADYEIIQPFRQLARELYAFTPDEARQVSTDRFEDRDVATGAIMGLTLKGWERGTPGDGGMITDYTRRHGDAALTIQVFPGIFVGRGENEARQSLGKLWLARALEAGPATLGTLDPIFASEVLRDLDLLNPALATPTA